MELCSAGYFCVRTCNSATFWCSTVLIVYSLLEANMGAVCACLPHLKPLLMRKFPRLLGVDEASSNRPITQVERIEHPQLDTLDSIGVSEVEEVESYLDRLSDSQAYHRGDLERSEENSYY
jgi:hypothetical protein